MVLSSILDTSKRKKEKGLLEADGDLLISNRSLSEFQTAFSEKTVPLKSAYRLLFGLFQKLGQCFWKEMLLLNISATIFNIVSISKRNEFTSISPNGCFKLEAPHRNPEK